MLNVAGGILLAILFVICLGSIVEFARDMVAVALLAAVVGPVVCGLGYVLVKGYEMLSLAGQHGVDMFFTYAACAFFAYMFLYPLWLLARGAYRLFKRKAKAAEAEMHW